MPLRVREEGRMKRFVVVLFLSLVPVLGQSAPGPPGDLASRLADADRALKAGQLARAVELYEDVIALDYPNFRAHFGLGLAFFKAGKLKEALFEFRQLTRLFPKRFEGWYNLGITQARLTNWKAAAEALAQAVAVGREAKLPAPALRPAYLALAEAYRKQGQPGLAAEVLSQAHRLLPDDLEVAYLLADALAAADRGEEAIPYLYQVLAKRPDDVRAALLLADVYVDQDLPERAVRVLDRALAATSDAKKRARLVYKKALVLGSLGADKKEVEALLEQATQADPDLWQAHYDVGRLKLALGDAKGALHHFLLAYRESPSDPRVLLGLASAYDVLGKARDAYRMAKLASRAAKGPERIEALFLLGKSAYRIGAYAEAVNALKEVVKERPNDADGWLWLGLALYAGQDYGQAVRAFERAAQLDNRVEVVKNLGSAYLAAKRFSDAERVFTQIVLQNPNDAESWYHLGWALKALGRDSEAKRAWKTALKLGYKPARGLVR